MQTTQQPTTEPMHEEQSVVKGWVIEIDEIGNASLKQMDSKELEVTVLTEDYQRQLALKLGLKGMQAILKGLSHLSELLEQKEDSVHEIIAELEKTEKLLPSLKAEQLEEIAAQVIQFGDNFGRDTLARARELKTGIMKVIQEPMNVEK